MKPGNRQGFFKALQWCQLRQKAKYLSFLRDEDKTFAKESFASSFQKGL